MAELLEEFQVNRVNPLSFTISNKNHIPFPRTIAVQYWTILKKLLRGRHGIRNRSPGWPSVHCGDAWQSLSFRRNRRAQGDSLRDGADGTVGFKWTCANPPLFRVGNESIIIDPFFCSSQGVRVGFTLGPENCIELILV
jgi:hypothetical protein